MRDVQPHGLLQLQLCEVRLFETPSRGPRQGTTSTMVSDSDAHSAFRWFLKLTARHSDSELCCFFFLDDFHFVSGMFFFCYAKRVMGHEHMHISWCNAFHFHFLLE